MNKTKLAWTVANIERMFDEKKVLSFDHPIQRQSEQWSNKQKSLLIHSMLANYPIPNIYVLREDSELVDEKSKPIFNYFVMDGKQRLTSVLSYIWGEFPLEEGTPCIAIEEEQYEIAGKYFCDLDEPVQYEIKRFKFEIIAFEDCTNEDVEEVFFRLNNSVPLTKSQVAKAKVGTDIAIFINEMIASKFVTNSCNFSNAQRKNSDDQRCLLQAMMLLDRNYEPGFELIDFSEKSIMAYAESIKGNYDSKKQDTLRSCIEYLSDAFPEKNKELRKISIPMLMYMSDYAMDKEIKPRFFRQWWEYFTEEDALWETYKLYGSSGSTKLEKVNGRLGIMAKSLCNYHEFDMPEELIELVEKVENENLAAKEENELKTTTSEDNQTDISLDETELVIEDEATLEENVSLESEETTSSEGIPMDATGDILIEEESELEHESEGEGSYLAD